MAYSPGVFYLLLLSFVYALLIPRKFSQDVDSFRKKIKFLSNTKIMSSSVGRPLKFADFNPIFVTLSFMS